MNNICLDIGGMSTKIIVFDKKGNILDKNKIMYEKNLDLGKTTLSEIFKKVEDVLKPYFEEQFNIGISMPGVVNSIDKKILIEGAIIDDVKDIEKYFKKFKKINKFIFENDGKSSAFGEFIFGKHDKVKNLVHLTIGTGIGCGIIIDGKIYKSSYFKSGEIGKAYSNITPNDKDSLVVMDTSVSVMLIKYKMATGKILNGEEIFELYEQKEEIASKIIKDWSFSLARLIVNLDHLLDFDLLTIGGGVSSNQKAMDLVMQKINENSSFTFMGMNLANNKEIIKKIKVSTLKNDAGCYGALALINEE